MLRLKHVLLSMCAVLLLLGCNTTPSSLPVMDRDQAFDRNQDRLSNLKSWQFDGRFSLRTPQGVQHANLTWLQEADHYLLKISGPLQQGAVFLRGNQSGIAYKDSKGVVDKADSAETLLKRHTQYDLPISSLRYWVLGRIDPKYPYQLTMNASGDLRTLTQQGWDIRFENFDSIEKYRLPSKIVLKREGMEIIISIHDWNPNLVAE